MKPISIKLNKLQLQYDTRLLATAMMIRAAHLLRCLVAAGKWTSHDVEAVVTEALADLHVPLETKPPEITRAARRCDRGQGEEGVTPEQYQAEQILALSNKLNKLELQYDARLLAAAMMIRAAHLLRCLVAAGKWTSHDVQAVATEALADLHVPLETKPPEMTLGPNDLPT